MGLEKEVEKVEMKNLFNNGIMIIFGCVVFLDINNGDKMIFVYLNKNV